MAYLINKNLNKFIFLGELANARGNPWNKERVQEWLKETGDTLSTEERSGIREYASVFTKVNFNVVEACFIIGGKNIWNNLREEIGLEETQIIKNCLTKISARFEILWQKEKLKLTQIKKYLTSQNKHLQSAFLSIINLSGANDHIIPLERISINLVLSSSTAEDTVGWFSSFKNNVYLVLECSGVRLSERNFLSLVLLHELFHFTLRKNNKVKKVIKNYSKKHSNILGVFSRELSPKQVLEELLISSFVPEGYIAHFYFGSKIPTTLSIKKNKDGLSFVSARQLCAYYMKEVARKYIREKKVIDADYVRILVDVIKKQVVR